MDRNESSSDDSVNEVPAAVEVAVQLSRFHMETIEGSATGDVDIRGLCLGVGDRELLTDAHLSLRRGIRYGLVGRNGCGKSTLLRSCANKSIPGLPRDMKVLYVQQENVPGDRRTALQTVLDAGSPRGALQAQIAELEAALDAAEGAEGGEGAEEGAEGEEGAEEGAVEAGAADGGHSSGGGGGDGGDVGGVGGGGETPRSRLVRCVRALLAERAEVSAVEAEQTAARRSRARGKTALKSAVAAREAAKKTQEAQVTPDEAASLAPQLLADLYDKLDELGGSQEEEQQRAVAVLEGLGFGAEQQQAPTRELSGGWRMRVALAAALLAAPHLLLLDEPTNHLDIQSILWLQDHLTARSAGQTVLLVSHDRSFLNAVAQETIVMRDARLEYFPGTYDGYMQAKAEASLHKERQVAGQERQRAHLVDTIARAEKAAREAGDDKRLLQAASRRKKIDRLGAEKTADGKRFKRSYWAGYHETQRPQVELDRPEEPVVLQLPPPEALRQRGPLLQLRGVTVAYGSAAAAAATAAAAPAPAPAAPQIRVLSKAGGGRGGKGSATAPEGTAPGGRAGSGRAPVGGGSGRASAAAAAVPAQAGPAVAAAAGSAAAGGRGSGGVVLTGVTMDIQQGARIGLLGLNGSGKSSLLRVVAGVTPPAAGEVTSPCPRLLLGFLDQHNGRRLLQQAQQPQQLQQPQQPQQPQQALAPQAESGAGGAAPTAFTLVQARAPHMRLQEVYDYLGKLAVPGPVASTPLAALSGGQRSRVALALEMLPRPHVLLLDEPTNHLDLLTVQALAGAIRAWEGAVVIASHDLQFLRDTCHEVWVVEGGGVTRQPQPEVADAIAAYTSRLLERLRRQSEKLRRGQ